MKKYAHIIAGSLTNHVSWSTEYGAMSVDLATVLFFYNRRQLI